jgi:[CysO sulfur-carrier protein]-S-L-cysteine hydrolase
MDRYFRITKKHYDIIVKQGIDNLPIESGGFVGGREDFIKGLLPIYNQYLEDQTGTFAFSKEDVLRAHQFFKKHDLEYYGLYHTHPKGAAYPSPQDIATGHRYHFILSLADPNQPIFAAYEIVNSKPINIPIIITEGSFKSKEIHAKKTRKKETHIDEIPVHLRNKSPEEEVIDLSQKIHDIKEDVPRHYPKMPPKHNDQSDFSTFA